MSDGRTAYPVTLMWGVFRDGKEVPVILDRKLQVIRPFLQYCIWLAQGQVTQRTSATAYRVVVKKAGTALLWFAQFMRRKSDRLTWDKITDVELEEFRDYCLKRTLSDSRCSDDLSARRTTNEKLICIYSFFAWAQEEQMIVESYVGLDGEPIRSSLPKRLRAGGRHAQSLFNADLYPLTFKRVGESGKGYFATSEDVDNLAQYFFDTCGPEVAVRNVLIVDLADRTGFRVGSISSLTVEDFSEKKIEEARSKGHDRIIVKPPVQKFGYSYSFDVDLLLAVRVRRYVVQERAAIVQRHCSASDLHRGPLFLSTSSGKPLKPETITEVVGDGLKAIGIEGRAAMHSLRRKFTEDSTRLELAARKERGLSTAFEDLMLPIARKLGQKSMHSQDPYHRAYISDVNESAISKKERQLLSIQAELAIAREEILRLKHLLKV